MSEKLTFKQCIELSRKRAAQAFAICDSSVDKAADLAVESSYFLLKASKLALENAKRTNNNHVNN